jgi:Putative Actinobacterial Holin-X, holin superfamily III
VFGVVERSIASLLKDIVGNVQQIIRAEVRLAKVEVAGELVKARRAMVLLAIGGLFGAATLAFLLLAAMYALAHVVPPWVAAALVALGTGAIGGVLIVVGARQLKFVSLPPARTVNSVQENIQWAKAQTR